MALERPILVTAPGPERQSARASVGRQLALLFGFALAARIYVILRYPLVFGGDTVLRLANHDRVLLSYQLPLLQTLVHLTSLVSTDPLPIRCVLALAGAGSALAVWTLLRPLVGPGAALGAAWIFAANPFILALSTVPYQETLMLGCLALAFGLAFVERFGWASLALGAACLTRYEAWLAVPALAGWFALRRGPTWRRLIEGSLLFGWAPLLWMAVHRGLAPSGTYVVEGTFDSQRLVRWAYLGWISLKQTPLPALPVAGLGAWIFFRDRLWRSRAYQTLGVFLALFLVAILGSAHGVGDQPERFVTVREAHVPLLAMTVLTAIGLDRMSRGRSWVVGAAVLVGLWGADHYVRRETSAPGFTLAGRIATYLDEHVQPGQLVVVLAEPVPGAADYLDKAEQTGGAEGRERALELLATTETSPPGYQRLLVQSRLEKDQLRSLSTLWVKPSRASDRLMPVVKPAEPPAAADWVVRWSDFTATNAAEEELDERARRTEPAAKFRDQALEARIYRLPRSSGSAAG